MITLYKSYAYDNKYEYIKTFSTIENQKAYFNSLQKEVIETDEYIKDYQSFNVEYDYETLLLSGINYLSFSNGSKEIYCFITRKESLGHNVTKLNYEIDVIQTFMFDFNFKRSFVERKVCSISEITDYDEQLEMGEHIIENNYKMLDKTYTYFAMFNGFKDYNIVSNTVSEVPAFDETRPITVIDGITYPLLFIALENSYISDIFKKYMISLPNLVGIIRLPNCTYTKGSYSLPVVKISNGTIIKSNLNCDYVANTITSVPNSSTSIPVPKTNITDFYPYTYYVLSDGETEPLIMQPQYLQDTLSINGKFALSHQPIERYYPNNYKNSIDGNIYNITNANIMMLPTGTNGGIETLTANVNQIEQQKKSMYTNIIRGGAMAVGGAMSGNALGLMVGAYVVNSAVDSYTTIKESIARTKDLELTPDSMKSGGTPSTRNAFGNNKVSVIKYTIQQKYKDRLNNFISRYGNKYNNYATIEHNYYKGYVKMNTPDIDSKIDNEFIQVISSIFERGVYCE